MQVAVRAPPLTDATHQALSRRYRYTEIRGLLLAAEQRRADENPSAFKERAKLLVQTEAVPRGS